MKNGDLLNDLKYIWLNFETSLFSKTTNFTGVRQTFPCIFHVSEGKQLREKTRKNKVCSAGYKHRDF